MSCQIKLTEELQGMEVEVHNNAFIIEDEEKEEF